MGSSHLQVQRVFLRDFIGHFVHPDGSGLIVNGIINIPQDVVNIRNDRIFPGNTRSYQGGVEIVNGVFIIKGENIQHGNVVTEVGLPFLKAKADSHLQSPGIIIVGGIVLQICESHPHQVHRPYPGIRSAQDRCHFQGPFCVQGGIEPVRDKRSIDQ
jgi:hypothetical protein